MKNYKVILVFAGMALSFSCADTGEKEKGVTEEVTKQLTGDNAYFPEGLRTNFITTNYDFIIEDAVLSASKAAYIAMLLIRDENEVKKFDDSIDLRSQEVVVDGYSKYFKSIKKITPEGFYYWKNAVELNENI
jgi:hypothetical protein